MVQWLGLHTFTAEGSGFDPWSDNLDPEIHVEHLGKKIRGADSEKRTEVYQGLWGGRNQIRSVAQLCPTLCDAMNCSILGLPVHHQLPDFVQTNVHQIGDAIQPSHLSSPFPPAFNLAQHQGLFQ